MAVGPTSIYTNRQVASQVTVLQSEIFHCKDIELMKASYIGEAKSLLMKACLGRYIPAGMNVV